MTDPLRVAFIGWGAINSRVGALLETRRSPVEIVGIAVRDAASAGGRLPRGPTLLTCPEDLSALRPDLVVEAAGRAGVELWGPAALCCAKALIVASTSAFTEDDLLVFLLSLAEERGSQIILPPGAIGGMDALAAAAVLDLTEVWHRVVKPPIAWRGTDAERRVDLDTLQTRTTFFAGSAREAASRYPQNANATVATALAGIGLDRTRVELIADPAASVNGHQITARGAFGQMEISLANAPLSTNPKSSELTALSLVRLIENQTAALVR